MPDRSADHLRLGDAEREQASALLRDHYAEGRLEVDEYSERLDAVWAARTRADLRPVFADLPGSPGMSVGMGGAGFSTPESRRTSAGFVAPRRPGVLRWVVPVLMIAFVITVVTHLPFVLLGLLVAWAVLHRRGPRRRGYDWHQRHHYGWR
jgi:hypothetical protein